MAVQIVRWPVSHVFTFMGLEADSNSVAWLISRVLLSDGKVYAWLLYTQLEPRPELLIILTRFMVFSKSRLIVDVARFDGYFLRL